ncbi:hypothetical protein LO763_11710 [Glycomyces sp. A-F 0318]|uniref:hypothetical protein n=1 Tax=Glycomyces amatae TaxID=2881355 RepID=UPI001E3A8F77|nr:hypothetical protein [Glycomyces amatae]MCD0444288.1 hypothetical protein [Glycomyces amatae]
MASKTQQAMEKIGQLLYAEPGFHDLEAIKTATGLSPQMTGRVLATLVDSGAVVVDDADGPDRWRWAQHPEAEFESPHEDAAIATEERTAADGDGVTEPESAEEQTAEPTGGTAEPDSETAASPASTTPEEAEGEADAPAGPKEGSEEAAAQTAAEPEPDPEGDGSAGESGTEAATAPDSDDQGDSETGDAADAEESEEEPTDAEGVAIQPVVLEHDPMVMLMARVLAEAAMPLTTRQVAEAAYMPMGTREVLTALRALAASELADCSKPFAPDEADCTWQRREGMEPGEFMNLARAVPMHAAPDQVTCPTCHHVRPIAGISRPRKRGGNLRADGSRKLAPGGLKRLAEEWLRRPENAGEVIAVGQLKRELRREHGDLVSDTSYGALRQLMEDQFSRPDPTDEDQRPLLVLEEGVTPISFRIRNLT